MHCVQGTLCSGVGWEGMVPVWEGMVSVWEGMVLVREMEQEDPLHRTVSKCTQFLQDRPANQQRHRTHMHTHVGILHE